MVDVISIKKAVENNELLFYVKNGDIFCLADNGDCVKVGETHSKINDEIRAILTRLGDEASWDKYPESGH